MKKTYVLYNPFSSNGGGRKNAESINRFVNEPLDFVNMSEINSYEEFFASLDADDKIILCGGDGTLNHFINDCKNKFPDNEIDFFGTGTGNDFLLDIGYKTPCPPVRINQFLADLPSVDINGKTYYFINNVAFGIDGWVCGIAELEKEKNKKVKSNYTMIAVRGLLREYSPCNATVTVDGNEPVKFERVWMAPSMNGRYFGGGMKVTPMQNRLNKDRTLTFAIYAEGNRLEIAANFITVFNGSHINNPKMHFFTGHDITVEFDRPTTLNIDGEPIFNVLKYRAYRL